jgi:hypothetical protein
MTGSDVGAADAGAAWHGLTPTEALDHRGSAPQTRASSGEVDRGRHHGRCAAARDGLVRASSIATSR